MRMHNDAAHRQVEIGWAVWLKSAVGKKVAPARACIVVRVYLAASALLFASVRSTILVTLSLPELVIILHTIGNLHTWVPTIKACLGLQLLFTGVTGTPESVTLYLHRALSAPPTGYQPQCMHCWLCAVRRLQLQRKDP